MDGPTNRHAEASSSFFAILRKRLKIYRKIILSGVSWGLRVCVTLNEERKLRVFMNILVREYFELTEGHEKGVCRKYHCDKVHSSYSSLRTIKRKDR